MSVFMVVLESYSTKPPMLKQKNHLNLPQVFLSTNLSNMKKINSELVYSVILNVCFIITGLITNKVASTHLSLKEFSAYGQTILFVTILTSVFIPGVNNAIVKCYPNLIRVSKLYILYIIVISLLIYALSKAFNIEIGIYFWENYSSELFWCAPLIALAYLVSQVILSNAIASNRKREYFQLSLVQTVLGAFLILFAVVIGRIEFIFAAIILRPALVALISIFLWIRKIARRGEYNIKFILSTWLEGAGGTEGTNLTALSFLFYGLISLASTHLGVMLLRDVMVSELGYEQAGLMYTAQRVFEITISFATLYYSTFYFKNIAHSKNPEKDVLNTILKVIVCFLPIIIVIVSFSEQIILMLFSSRQLEASIYFPMFGINALLLVVSYPIGFYLLSHYSKVKLAAIDIFAFIGLCVLLKVHNLSDENIVWILVMITFSKLLVNVVLFVPRYFSNENSSSGLQRS
ncbi:hypothetical protein [uncultured Ferrimonas sp.]|uniref:hypothetical protein n=1 Tax=uncultured Ferrimonas sp. TaxID=432640 RepID=UPI00260D1D35|nr:hypothetical protein [uncultured Ferrimonas sp.]